MKIGYFPGCSLTGTSKEFDLSLRQVLSQLDVEVVEINDWSCCGSSSAHITSHLLSVALPARNLNLAIKQGLKIVVAPCAACYSRLVMAQHEMKENPDLKAKVEEVLNEKVLDGVEIINIVQMFKLVGKEKLEQMKKVNLSGLNAACYYGCLLG